METKSPGKTKSDYKHPVMGSNFQHLGEGEIGVTENISGV